MSVRPLHGLQYTVHVLYCVAAEVVEWAQVKFSTAVVTICTAQWSLYVPHSGHYTYRTVVTICTAQWSLYAPHSGHCMFRTVVTICIAQWSLYVPHSGHYMYRTVVTICTAQWSLYVPHSGHYVQHSGHCIYRTVVTICTAQWSLYVPPGLTYSNATFCPHSVFMCGSQNKQRLFSHTALTDWFL